MSRRPTAADLRRLFDGLSANDRTRFVQSEAFQADARAIYLDQLEQALNSLRKLDAIRTKSALPTSPRLVKSAPPAARGNAAGTPSRRSRA